MKLLTVLNPKYISSTQRHNSRHIEDLVSRYESLIEYQRTIGRRLKLNKIIKRPLRLEVRAICNLISVQKVFVEQFIDFSMDYFSALYHQISISLLI